MANQPSSHSDPHGHDTAGLPANDGTVPAMDYPAHEAMFNKFTGLVKWGIVACVVLVIFLFIAIHPMVPPPAS